MCLCARCGQHRGKKLPRKKWILDFRLSFHYSHRPAALRVWKKICYHGRWKSNEKHLFFLPVIAILLDSDDWWLFGFSFGSFSTFSTSPELFACLTPKVSVSSASPHRIAGWRCWKVLRITKDEIDFYYSRNLHSVAGRERWSLCRINGENLTLDSVAVQHIQAGELNRSQAAA